MAHGKRHLKQWQLICFLRQTCFRQHAQLPWPNWLSLESYVMIQVAQDGALGENTWGLELLNLHLNVSVHT